MNILLVNPEVPNTFWSFKHPQTLPMAVRYSIYGYHFRRMLKSMQPQMNELALARPTSEGTLEGTRNPG
jgi:hypothetical protein